MVIFMVSGEVVIRSSEVMMVKWCKLCVERFMFEGIGSGFLKD